MINAIPGLKNYPHLLRAFDAEYSAALKTFNKNSCAKCSNNTQLKIIRKYQKLMEDIKKSQRG